jgi:hypothetical protein
MQFCAWSLPVSARSRVSYGYCVTPKLPQTHKLSSWKLPAQPDRTFLARCVRLRESSASACILCPMRSIEIQLYSVPLPSLTHAIGPGNQPDHQLLIERPCAPASKTQPRTAQLAGGNVKLQRPARPNSSNLRGGCLTPINQIRQ